MENYSQIVKNQQQIKDLFQKLKIRGERIERSLCNNHERYYRGYKQSVCDLALKRKHYDYQQEVMWKKGINLTQQFKAGGEKKAGKNVEKAIPRPGYGKHDLDTGLSREARNRLVAKSVNDRPKTGKARRENDEFHQYAEKIKLSKEVHVENAKQAGERAAKFGAAEWNSQSPGQPRKTATLTAGDLEQMEEKQKQATQQQDQDDYAFQQMFAPQPETGYCDAHLHPIVKTLFSPEADLTKDIPHLKYLECLATDFTVEQIISKLRDDYQREIINHGHNRFKTLLKECVDRRVLFRLVRKDNMTFDQFVTRVHCDTKGVKYQCKDDLLAKGVSKRYFEDNQHVERYLLAQHDGKTLIEIDPDSITYQCGRPKIDAEAILENPEYRKLNYAQINKRFQDERAQNQWRCCTRCLKSNFTVIDADLKQRQMQRITDQKTGAKKQEFSKIKTTRVEKKAPTGAEKRKLEEKEFEKQLKAKFSKYRSPESTSGSKAKNVEALGSNRQVSQRAGGANETSPNSPSQDQHCQKHQRKDKENKPNSKSVSQAVSPRRQKSQGILSDRKGVLSQAGSEPWSSFQGQGADEDQAASFADGKSKKGSNATSANYRAKQAKKENDEKKNETNMELIFIRKLRDIDGLNISSDPACEINLMYEHERNLHFRKEEKRTQIPRKRGPREILHPEKMTIERAECRESFDKEEFKAKIYKSLRAAKIIKDLPDIDVGGHSESETNVAASHWREHENIHENFTGSVIDSCLAPNELTEYLSENSQAAQRREGLDQITEEKSKAQNSTQQNTKEKTLGQLQEMGKVKIENTVIFSKDLSPDQNQKQSQKAADKVIFDAKQAEKAALIPKEVSLDLLDIDVLSPSHGYQEAPIKSGEAMGNKGRRLHKRLGSAHITSKSPNRCLRSEDRNIFSSNPSNQLSVHETAESAKMISRNQRQGGHLNSVQNPLTLGAFSDEKGHDQGTGLNGVIQMDSELTSAIHTGADQQSRNDTNDKNRSIADGRGKRQLAATISSLEGYFATLNDGVWQKKFKRDRVRPKSSAGGGFQIQKKRVKRNQRVASSFSRPQTEMQRLSYNPSSPTPTNGAHGFQKAGVSLNTTTLDNRVVQYVRNLGFSVNSGQMVLEGKHVQHLCNEDQIAQHELAMKHHRMSLFQDPFQNSEEVLHCERPQSEARKVVEFHHRPKQVSEVETPGTQYAGVFWQESANRRVLYNYESSGIQSSMGKKYLKKDKGTSARPETESFSGSPGGQSPDRSNTHTRLRSPLDTNSMLKSAEFIAVTRHPRSKLIIGGSPNRQQTLMRSSQQEDGNQVVTGESVWLRQRSDEFEKQIPSTGIEFKFESEEVHLRYQPEQISLNAAVLSQKPYLKGLIKPHENSRYLVKPVVDTELILQEMREQEKQHQIHVEDLMRNGIWAREQHNISGSGQEGSITEAEVFHQQLQATFDPQKQEESTPEPLNIQIHFDNKRNKKISEVYPEAKLSQVPVHDQIKLTTKLRHNALLSPKSLLDGTKEIMTIMSNSSGGSPHFSATGKSGQLLNIIVAHEGIISPPRYAEEPGSIESLLPLEQNPITPQSQVQSQPTSARGKMASQEENTASFTTSGPSHGKAHVKARKRSREETKKEPAEKVPSKQLQQRGNAVRLQRLHRQQSLKANQDLEQDLRRPAIIDPNAPTSQINLKPVPRTAKRAVPLFAL